MLRQVVVVCAVCAAACSSDSAGGDAGAATIDGGAAMSDGGAGASADAAGAACTALFGVPAESTGLSAEQCAPSCPCKGFTFEPYDEDTISSWVAATHLNPPSELTEDPYDQPAPDVGEQVCGVLSEEAGYRTQTYATEAAALAGRARVTHFGPCGACSSLANLAVYARYPDLTQPVRECGLEGLRRGMQANIDCLLELGFELPCAQVWYYNTNHTREACLLECLAALNEPYHTEDGELNECLQCDERESGPVFKAVAGRTRRNTGLATALCRPCDEVRPLVHDYPPGP